METYAAPKSEEETQDWRSLTVIRGHDKEQAMVDTIFTARDIAMLRTDTYDPADEFEGLTVLQNFKTYENFDAVPSKWSMYNWSWSTKGAFVLYPKSTNSQITYKDLTANANGRPIQVVLGAGWFRLDIYDPNGSMQSSTVHVPIIAMNADRSLIESARPCG